LAALKAYGGFIIDLDYVCLQPLEELAYRYSYVSSLEPA
jgi:mannosyltransferase OCH1-like enzyme